jgi:IS30 family transposase
MLLLLGLKKQSQYDVPSRLRLSILTDNGIQFTNHTCHKYTFKHIFLLISSIVSSHPWTNGQVERMNRTLKDATVKKLELSCTEMQT